MISRFALRLFLAVWAIPAFCLPAPAVAAELPSQVVAIPGAMMIPAPEALKALFPKGFTPGLGYGLSFAQEQPGQGMILHTLTGRGPTMPGPMVSGAGAGRSTIFILPGYTPCIVTMKLSDGRAEVLGQLPLKDEDGAPLRGLPPPPEAGDQAEIPLDLSLKRLALDPHGLYPTGVAYDFKLGQLWIADAYRPSLLAVSPGTGQVVRSFSPGDGLEDYLATRRPGWGFMGASISPTGKVYTIMRGVLSAGGKPGIFSRIVELDPNTERVRQLPYPIDDETFADPSRVSTGDVVALADKRLLVLEQGIDKQGRPRSLLYAVDLSRANNINHVHDDAGNPPEAVTDKALLQKDFQLAQKTLVLELHDSGFAEKWAESMTLLPDGRTLAIMGGHGFGLEERITGAPAGPDGNPVLDPERYLLAPDGTLTVDGKPVKASFGVSPTQETPRLWLVTLPKKAVDY